MSSLFGYLEAKTSLVVSLLATCIDERFSVSSLVRSVWLRFVHQSFVIFHLKGQDCVDSCHFLKVWHCLVEKKLELVKKKF